MKHKRNPLGKRESIADTNQRLKEEAKSSMNNHIDTKPIKYMLKW